MHLDSTLHKNKTRQLLARRKSGEEAFSQSQRCVHSLRYQWHDEHMHRVCEQSKEKDVFMFHRRKSYMFEQLEFEFGWNIALRCSRHECARNPGVTVTLYFPLCCYRLCQRLRREVWCAEGPNGQGALIRSLVNTQMRCFTCSQRDDAVVIALVFRAPARLRRWRSRARRIRRPVRWKQVRRNTHLIIN